jgi:NADH-quinone oxidoreductase subunit N
MTITMQDIQTIIPELFLTLTTMLLLLVGVYRKRQSAEKLSLLGAVVLLLTGILVLDGQANTASVFGGVFSVNPFISVMKCLVLIGATLVLFMTVPVLRSEESERFEFPLLVMLATLGLMLMVSANDLLALYLGLELASLSMYVLAAFDRDGLRSQEAGMKYFVLGAVASGMLLFGCSLVYGFTGVTGFADLSRVIAGMDINASAGLMVGLVFIIIGFCFKISAVPFHMWAPDVYEGAPTQVTAFFAVAPKVAGLTLFIRVLAEPFATLVEQWQQVVIFVAVASMVVGAFVAIRQHNIKRLLAYSSIGHVGYALMAVAVYSTAGLQAIIVYLVLYVVMSVGAFGCVLLMRRKGKFVEEIHDLRGLSRTHPKLALAMAIFMFSMAGIPPMAGFFGKMVVFLAVLNAGMVWLAVVGVLASVVAAYYYLRVVKVMYLDEVETPLDADIDPEMKLLLTVTSLVTLFYMLYPTPLFDLALVAAQSMGLS